MAFKPIVIEKEIDGVTYKAQFNGVSAMYDIADASEGSNNKLVAYLFENVIVEPKISDIDDYFGTDTEHLKKVVEFAGAVARADKKYFPATDKNTTKTKGN